jgi:DNA-binding CsgD family transcriptional regulator
MAARNPPSAAHFRPEVPETAENWPFVGRAAEMAALTRELAVRGAVVVAGAAGVGKSRLAGELVAAVAARGAGVATASRSASEIPLGALAPLLGADAVEAGLHAAARSLRRHPVLLIDDAHHLDPVSATVLHQVVAARGTRVVLTVRSGLPAPDAVTALWKDGLATRVELAALEREQTTEVLRTVLGGPVDAVAERRLYEITGGNLLWLRLVVEGERDAGRLVRTDGVWYWRGQASLSPALEELVAAQIGELSPPQRRVLELLALGEPIGLGLLESLAGAEAVEETAERALIAVRPDGSRWEVRLGHPLYGEAVRGWMSPPRMRRVRGELGEALGAFGGRRSGDGLRRAVLDLDSDRPGDPELLGTAGAHAVALGDADLGLRLFRAARDAGGGFEAQISLGFLTGWLFGAEEADVELARAVEMATTPAERARAVQARAFNRHFLLALPDEATALLDDATGIEEGDLDGVRATFAVVNDDLAEGADRVFAASANPTLPPAGRVMAGWAALLARAFGGLGPDIEETAATARQAAGTALDVGALRNNIGFAECLGFCLDGRIADARGVVDRIRAGRGDAAEAFGAFYEGRIALETGHARTAYARLSSLRPIFPGKGGGQTTWIELMAAAAAAMAGEIDDAVQALARAREHEHPGMAVLGPQLSWAQAWVRAAQGATNDALGVLHQAADRAAASRQFAIEVVVRHTAVCFGDRDQVRRLEALRTVVAGARVAAAADHAGAWAARDPAALLATSDQLEGLELLQYAADAAAQAASLAAANGDHPRAAAASRRARELAEHCGGLRTPALTAGLSPVAVSAREREVATLAASGLSNREIAERMHVSMRTVESHIYRACARLGLSSRAEFVASVVPGAEPRRAP